MEEINKESEYQWCLEDVKKFNVQINCLAEIGSRDGFDAIKLTKEFKPTKTYIFEADPRLAKNIEKNISKYKKDMNLNLFNIALGSEDKTVTFHAVDEKKYDNDGVGSLYVLNFEDREESDPDYKIGYIQKEINVEQKKYTSLDLDTPDLIAMDVESAELEVLKGLGEQLDSVKIIILETSIHKYHFGGSNFIEIHNYIKPQFKLIKNRRYGNKNYKIFQDHYKYKFSKIKKFQNAFDLLYVNKSILL
tara:strand:- start:3314 stop:4057 length:744 start_codon:yes stop_codon:yes gene_type:complete